MLGVLFSPKDQARWDSTGSRPHPAFTQGCCLTTKSGCFLPLYFLLHTERRFRGCNSDTQTVRMLFIYMHFFTHVKFTHESPNISNYFLRYLFEFITKKMFSSLCEISLGIFSKSG